MTKKIAFFDTKPYDRKSFDEANRDFDFDITYFDAHLNKQTVSLCKKFDGVCAFVNDTIDRAVIKKLIKHDIKIIGLRCAGYNNVDFKAAKEKIIKTITTPVKNSERNSRIRDNQAFIYNKIKIRAINSRSI